MHAVVRKSLGWVEVMWLTALVLGATALRLVALAPAYTSLLSHGSMVSQVLQSMPDDEALQLAECAELQRYDVNPYQGTVCSTPPLLLWLYSGISSIDKRAFSCVLVACDLLAGLLLWRLAQLLIGRSSRSQGAKVLLLSLEKFLLVLLVAGRVHTWCCQLLYADCSLSAVRLRTQYHQCCAVKLGPGACRQGRWQRCTHGGEQAPSQLATIPRCPCCLLPAQPPHHLRVRGRPHHPAQQHVGAAGAVQRRSAMGAPRQLSTCHPAIHLSQACAHHGA